MTSKLSLDALKAAYYRVYDPALTQEQIARKAGLGQQAQVSRLLTAAREHRVLQEVFRFPPDLSQEDRLEIVNSFFARHGQLEDALSQRSRKLSRERSGGGSPFKQLYVVAAPGIENETDARVRANAFSSFGMSAAGIVASYIDEVDMCCVAWGRTIAATVEQMPYSNDTSASNGNKQFIPIAGEPTNHEPNRVSASDAARRLSLSWPGSKPLSLRGVQARIPKSIHDQDGGQIAYELIRYSTSYRQIFGAPDSNETPLISEVPMILTGIGNVDTSKRNISGVGPDPWYLETVEAEEPNVLELAVGNIGGVWIARNEISDEDKTQVEKVNERWLGAQYDHFRSCSLNADLLHHRPGVVVLAVEPDKAAIVLEALHLINVLIVSRQLADELARRLLPRSAG
jgi:DNA-binding transcriptional regulator LsrR (DeoR family)